MEMMESTYFEERAPSERASTRERLFALAIVGTVLGALAYIRFFNPANPATNYYPACPFNRLTGFYCPGCGTLRGLHQLTHGHLVAALDYNVFMVLALPFFGYTLLSYAMVAARGWGLPKPFIRPVFIKAAFWAIAAFWILRNIPVYPFTILAP